MKAEERWGVRTAMQAAAEWAGLIALLLFMNTTLLQAFVVPSGSMEGTLLVGDHLFVDKLVYSPSGPVSRHLLPYREVRRGDVIVFKYPLDVKTNYVKRVVGVPGDRVRLVDQRVFVNGRALNEPYAIHTLPYPDHYRDNFPAEPNVQLPEAALRMLRENVVNGELVVPAGQYFALGDNRDNSLDSRYWGFVPRENIIGQPLFVFWSYDAPGERLQDPNFIGWAHAKDLALNFFTKTRWERTFRLVKSAR